MGTGIRVFLVHEHDSIERFSVARFERLRDEDSEGRLPQYAGKKIRYVIVFLETKDRKPVDILHIDHSYLLFDSEGRLDPKEKEIVSGFTIDLIAPLEEKENKKIIDARNRFVQKRYADRYRWESTPEIAKSVVEAIFGKRSK